MVMRKMEIIFLNLKEELLSLSQTGPPMVLVDGSLWDLVLLVLGGLGLGTGAVQMLRALVRFLQDNQIFRKFLEKRGKGGIPGGMPESFRREYFRIAQGINLEFRKLESLITARLPVSVSLLQQISKLERKVYHDLEKRFYRRGRR